MKTILLSLLSLFLSFSFSYGQLVINGPAHICYQEQGVIYSVAERLDATYTWTVPIDAEIVSGQNTNQIVVNFGSTGNISVVVVSGVGTESASLKVFTIVVDPVQIEIYASDEVICIGEAVTFTTSLGTTCQECNFSWFVDGSLMQETGASLTLNELDHDALVRVEVMFHDVMCLGDYTSYKEIQVIITPFLATYLDLYTESVCTGDPVTFYAQSIGIDYFEWYVDGVLVKQGTENTYTANQLPTPYSYVTVYGYSSFPCVATPFVTSQAQPVYLSEPQPAVCGPDLYISGTSANLSANPTGDIQYDAGYWTRISGCGDILSMYNPLSPVENLCSGQNLFIWTIQNHCGSSSDTMAVNVAADPGFMIFGPDIVEPGLSYIFSVADESGASYNWSVPGIASILAGQGTNKITARFDYAVLLKLAGSENEVCVERTMDGLTQTACHQVNYLTTGTVAGQAHVKVFPNPFSSSLQLEYLQTETLVTISDIHGQVIESTELSGSGFIGEKLPAGIYFLTLTTIQGAETIKVIKQ